MARKQLSMCKWPRLLALHFDFDVKRTRNKEEARGREAHGTQAAKHMQLASPRLLTWSKSGVYHSTGSAPASRQRCVCARPMARRQPSTCIWPVQGIQPGLHRCASFQGKRTRDNEEARVREAHGAQAAEHVHLALHPRRTTWTETGVHCSKGSAPATTNRRVCARRMARRQPSTCSSGVVPSKNTWMAAPNSAMRLPYSPSAQLAKPRP